MISPSESPLHWNGDRTVLSYAVQKAACLPLKQGQEQEQERVADASQAEDEDSPDAREISAENAALLSALFLLFFEVLAEVKWAHAIPVFLFQPHHGDARTRFGKAR